MKKLIALTAAVGLLSGLAIAASADKGKKTPKVKDVWVCPVSSKNVKKEKKEKGTVVGAYRVHFCCDQCPAAFGKMSKADQLKKAKEAAAKDGPKKGKKS